MAFTDDTRKSNLEQHVTTTRILNEIKSMADELLLPDIPIKDRADELKEAFKDVNIDSKCVMSWIVFLFRIKRGGAIGPPSQEKYDDVCKKIGTAIDKHPQELLALLGQFCEKMNEIDAGKSTGGKKIKITSSVSGVKPPAGKGHLADDDPYVVCNACGRKSWGAKAGERCNMPQPSGVRCQGRFIR